MRILVVGSGGREHALAWKLAQEAEIFCAPGNPGMAEVGECLPISVQDHENLARVCMDLGIDLVVVGPEDPLVAGLSDRLRGEGIHVFGPGAEAAKLEASKAFSKELMVRAGVPTARFEAFADPLAAKAFAGSLLMEGRGVVIKASGNALGKGVVLCSEPEEAEEAIESMLVDKVFGAAGNEIVVEERLSGREYSLLTFCSGTNILSLPVAQDYKRALDGDRGPNTGGMGSFAPATWVSPDLVAQTEQRTVIPILTALKERGIDYRGVLFSGMLVQDGLPYCLEYNVRFGDPETQSVMRLLGDGFARALMACAKGETIPEFSILDRAAVTVVVASGGYPGTYSKGKPISIGVMPEDIEIFHAGTALVEGLLVTSGGRVLGISALADTVEQARARAYGAAKRVDFEGAYLRSDIAA